jgi:DeoR/GlpR family transcriptional regulator of sugar metabolism
MHRRPLVPPDAADAGDRPQAQVALRRGAICDELVATGAVRVHELVARFGVTSMTIYRDISALEEQGWARKVRGGAVVEPAAQIDSTVRHRMTARAQEKLDIARAALGHVGSGDAVILDDSTTSLALARLLPGRGPLTVITNFLPAVNALARERSIELIVVGGGYDRTYERFDAWQGTEGMDRLRARTLFMSSTAIMADGGLYHTSRESILIRRAMMEAAERRVLLMDGSKFRRPAVHRLAPVSAFDLVIVDAGTDPRHLAMLRSHGVDVEVAGG